MCLYALKVCTTTLKQMHTNTKHRQILGKLMQEFKKFCGNLSMEQVDAAFKAFDLSGDNKLDYDEFCKLMNNRYVDCFQMH